MEELHCERSFRTGGPSSHNRLERHMLRHPRTPNSQKVAISGSKSSGNSTSSQGKKLSVATGEKEYNNICDSPSSSFLSSLIDGTIQHAREKHPDIATIFTDNLS